MWPPSLSLYWPPCYLGLYAAGLASGWLLASVCSANTMSRSLTRPNATPLLKLNVETLRLRPDAPFAPQKREPAQVVWLRG